MSFLDYKNKFSFASSKKRIETAAEEHVQAVIEKELLSFDDYLLLLSGAASKKLGALAEKAAFVTRQKFGKVINLYAPLYLSNDCVNNCLYCSFNAKNKVERKTLSIGEIKKEAAKLKTMGFQNVLLVSSENPKKSPLRCLNDALKEVKKKFAAVSFEIYPLNTDGYKTLAENGADGLTIYQETYNETAYEKMHPSGKKRDYGCRLETPERAIKGGFKKISIGALLGLNDWKEEAFYLGLHLDYLIKNYWKVFFSVSFPRIKNAPEGFNIPAPMSDRDFVQLLCAVRLFKPEIGINLSTREKPEFRDNLIGIGVTSMSAGSKTNPGGYFSDTKTQTQFDVSDERTPGEIFKAIQKKGFQPVFKDWEKIL